MPTTQKPLHPFVPGKPGRLWSVQELIRARYKDGPSAISRELSGMGISISPQAVGQHIRKLQLAGRALNTKELAIRRSWIVRKKTNPNFAKAEKSGPKQKHQTTKTNI